MHTYGGYFGVLRTSRYTRTHLFEGHEADSKVNSIDLTLSQSWLGYFGVELEVVQWSRCRCAAEVGMHVYSHATHTERPIDCELRGWIISKWHWLCNLDLHEHGAAPWILGGVRGDKDFYFTPMVAADMQPCGCPCGEGR